VTPTSASPSGLPAELHIDASEPGEKVELDCFFIGRLTGTKGSAWHYTAADVASGFLWAELHASEGNPRARSTSELVHRVARELKAAGWRLKEATTDNGSEFRSRHFEAAVEAVGACQRFINAGRPNANGCVDLEECGRPAFARSLVPKSAELESDLDEYLAYFNFDRAHTGRLTHGRAPADSSLAPARLGL
jgi:Integrase core domain